VAHYPEFLSRSGPRAWKLQVWVQPGAKKTEPTGEYQGCLKFRLAAPPVDNKANKALVRYVAKSLGLKPSAVNLESGQTSRRKVLSVTAEKEPSWETILPESP
jgi:hypothetical protein